MPLALVQAGAYMQATNLTVKEYMTHYAKTWDTLMAYQDRYPLQEYADRSVLTTWKVSYDQVRAISPKAAMLLDQWAFLHPGEMSYHLIDKYALSPEHATKTEDSECIAIDELSFHDSLGVLEQYSLVYKTEGMDSFSIHVVVHAWSLYNIVNDEVRERLCMQAIRMIAESIPPSNDSEDLRVARKLLPHARMAASRHCKMREMTGLESELHAVASFMQDWESSQEVEYLYTRSLKGKEEAWGANHMSTLSTVNNLGVLYYDQGQLNKAEQMYVRALRGYEEAWKVNRAFSNSTTDDLSISTLSTIDNFGLLYRRQGKLQEAEEMYVRALRWKEEAWGAKHISTLSTINNLGLLYKSQGKLKDAEEMLLRALWGKEEAWGAKHISTLSTVNNLGLVYRRQGKLEEAGEMLVRALKGKEEALGRKHTSTLSTVNNLGLLYWYQERLEEAKEMLLRALRSKEEVLGAKHTSTLDTLNNLGVLYSDQGKTKEAEVTLLQALTGYKEVLGTGHTSALATMYNLGDLYRDQGDVVRARDMYGLALKGYGQAQGDYAADIVYLQDQLSILEATSAADLGHLPAYGQSYVYHSITRSHNQIAHNDTVDSQEKADELRNKHRKRDRFLRMFKK